MGWVDLGLISGWSWCANFFNGLMMIFVCVVRYLS